MFVGWNCVCVCVYLEMSECRWSMLAPPKLKAWHWSGKWSLQAGKVAVANENGFVLQGRKSPVGGRSAFSVKDRDLSFGLRKVGFRVNRRGSRCRMSGRSGSCRVSVRNGRCRVNGRSSRCKVSGRSGRCRVSGRSSRCKVNGRSGRCRVSGRSSRRRVSKRSGRCRASGRSSRCRVSGRSSRCGASWRGGECRVG